MITDLEITLDTDNTFGAKLGLAEAITSGKSPEQTAADLQFARRLKMPAGYVQSMPPEDRAAEEVNLQDWATLQATTPVLMQKMTEPSFANLVKDSITDVGLLEATWWKISPNPGQQDGWLTTFRNSLARGGYQLPSQFAERALEDTSAELNRIRETETALAEGRSIKELFGSETDPEGDVGYKLFMANKDAQKEYLRQRALANSTTLAFSNRMAGLFPQSKAMEELREQQTLGDALGVFAQNPLSIIADVGPESLLRNAPQLAAMAAAAPAGVIPAALGAGAGSYQAEYAAAVPEAMKELGLDITKPEDIVAFYTNPENKQVLQSSQEKARQRASAVAAFDALSAGLASTMLVPKMVAKHFGTRTVEATNLVSQAAVQGALGGAGEALGQYAADGEIKSWADVVAEFAGEFTTAPVDVMAAATKVSVENGGMKVSAEQFAVDTARLEDYAKTSTLLQRDPQSFADYVKAVQEQHPDTNAIYVDAQALHQAGGDALMQATPELAARYDRALKEGGDLQLTVEEFMTQVAPRDANNLMAETAHPEGFPSLAEARQLEVDLSQEITDRLSQSVSDKDLAFQQSSAAVGDTIGTMLRDAFQDPEKIGKRADPGMMTTTQIQTVQAYLQTLVNNMAADSGMTPEQVWSKYGARGFLGPKDVKRGDKGGIVPVSERAKSLLTPKAKDNLSQEATEARKAAGPRYERLSGVRKPDSATVPVIELGELERLSQNGEKLSDFLYRELAGQTLTIKATGQNVLISKAGLKRSLKKRTAAHHAVYGRLVNVIESAEYDGTEKNDREKSHFTDQDVYHSAVRIGGKLYAVRVKVDVATPREKHLQNKGLQKTKFDARYADHQVAEIDVSEVKESPVGNGSDEPDGLGSQGVASARNAVADRTDTVTLGVIRGLVKPHTLEEGVLYQDTLGEYLPDARVIVQWANANRSTFLHETGHLFLNMRVAMARDLKAAGAMTASQQYAVQATEDALKWLGTDIETFSKMTLEEQRPLHEKFARTYEAYLMEGQSPNKGLTKLFRRFTSWLKSVYSTVDAIPGQAISDDVREIFDRLMTASAYAEEAKARRAQYAAFKNADEARMSAELWEEYQQRQKEASEASVQELTEKLSRDAKRFANLRRKKLGELTAKARATYDALFDAYWGAVKNSKAFKAHNLLIEGKLVDGKLIQPKLVERELKALGLSEADLRMLDNLGLVAKKSPMGGEAVAQAQGYDSFDAMVHDLLKLGDPVQAVRDQTATAMLERYGEMSTPKKIQEAADLAVFNESRLRVIEAEVKAFNTALGNKIENLQIFRAGAKQRVAGYKLGELRRRMHDHAVAAGRRARDSDKARKAGQTQEAAALKNQQAWQSVLVNEGKDQFETVRRQLKAFKKYTKEDAIRGIDPQYLVLVQHILSKIGEGREFPVSDAQRDMIVGFMANGEFRGPLEGVADLADAPIELLRRIEEGQYPGVEELTCEEFSDLADVLTELITQGKNAAAMTVAGKKVEFKQIRHELAEAVETQAGIRGREKRDEREKTGRAAQIADALRAIGMSHARIPSLLAAMEGTRFGGMFKYIVRPAQECDSRERELVNKYTQAIFDILGNQLSKLAGTRRKYFENPGVSLTRQEIFTMALNMGNAGNKQRLLDNSSAWAFMDGRTLTEEEVKGLMSSELTAEDLQSVQKIWDLFDDLRRLIEEKELRKRGRIPKWVEPEAFDVLSSNLNFASSKNCGRGRI